MQSTAKLTENTAGLLGIAADTVAPGGVSFAIEGAPKAEVQIERLAPDASSPLSRSSP